MPSIRVSDDHLTKGVNSLLFPEITNFATSVCKKGLDGVVTDEDVSAKKRRRHKFQLSFFILFFVCLAVS